MKLCITEIHLGRYRLEWLDENNQVLNGTDGGSALIMMSLNAWIFHREHAQYMKDQRSSSNAIGEAAISQILTNADTAQREALAELERKRATHASQLLKDFVKDKPNR